MRIEQLKLFSSRIREQASFYSDVLEMPIVEQSDKRVVLQCGESKLIFEYRPSCTPYHFAINIPSNQEYEALEWLKKRVNILLDGDNEIQDFDFWNAKAIYFYDKDNNIVEFIARKNLDNGSNKKFDSSQLLRIAEIGVPVSDIEPTYLKLKELTGVEIFDGNFERFCAIGDEYGLFICINKEKKKWFPTDDEGFSSDFEVSIMEKGVRHAVQFKDQRLYRI